MATKWTRRQVLGSALAGAASLAGGVPAWAAAKTLNVLGHRVHQNSLTTGVAGDLAKPWRDSHDADIVWTTFDTDPLQDRLFARRRRGPIAAAAKIIGHESDSNRSPTAFNQAHRGPNPK